MGLEAAIAVTRFGLGAQPGEIDAVGSDAETWLQDQLAVGSANLPSGAGLMNTADHIKTFFDYQVIRRSRRRAGAEPQVDPEAAQSYTRHIRRTMIAEITARIQFGQRTNTPFHERLTRFWANHFSVSGLKFQVAAIAGAYEREAIRPNILGTFSQLAEAAIFHPAMLIYLDNWQSVGPNSSAGRRRNRGLNENLAREVLELHTVTPTSGYTQDDVTAFARALTGWTVGNPRLGSDHLGRTLFSDRLHEPGAQNVLGTRYSSSDGEQARAIVRDLSVSSSTALNISKKLARHFVADDPPDALVRRLQDSFLDTGGQLVPLYQTLIEAPEAWQAEQQKVKTPDELLTSSARMLGIPAVFAGKYREVLESLAQRPFAAPSPEGWPDTAQSWLGPDSLSKRIEWANQVAIRLPVTDARDFLDTALGELLSRETRQSVARAESGAQALTLALMSPEFQRR